MATADLPAAVRSAPRSDPDDLPPPPRPPWVPGDPYRLVGPSHNDLPFEDGVPVDNAYQPSLAMLLTGVLTPWLDVLRPAGDFFIASNNGIYFRETDPPLAGCRAPDWYCVTGVPRLLDGELRKSYVRWREGVPPLIVMEFVSGTGAEERDRTPQTGKFWVYERAIDAGYYLIWDWSRNRLEVFVQGGDGYVPVPANARGRFPVPPLRVEFGVWEGSYYGHTARWLRAWDADGNLLPTPEERADAERAKAEKLAAKLRELGLDPDAV